VITRRGAPWLSQVIIPENVIVTWLCRHLALSHHSGTDPSASPSTIWYLYSSQLKAMRLQVGRFYPRNLADRGVVLDIKIGSSLASIWIWILISSRTLTLHLHSFEHSSYEVIEIGVTNFIQLTVHPKSVSKPAVPTPEAIYDSQGQQGCCAHWALT
jgi:hypothetical protein